MTDLFAELGRSPSARRLFRRLGLPIPLPHTLRRASGPWESLPLAEHVVVVGEAAQPSALQPVVARTLIRAGANPRLVGGDLGVYRVLGEAFGRVPTALELGALPAPLRADAIVFDASTLEHPAELGVVYEFFHALVPKLSANARAVVLGRPAALAGAPAAAAAQGALEGFVRSLAKEIGRSGATAQLLAVEPGAEHHLEPLLRFLLSARSAFVSGQAVAVRASLRPPAEAPLIRPLEGKVALVTGAARGIGEATARSLAAEGAKLVCVDRAEEEILLGDVASSLGASVVIADLSDPDAAERIARALEERHRGVDVIVHNAGVTRDKTLSRMSREQWDQTLDVNLAAVCRLDDALVSKLLRDDGRVICVSSVAGIAGNVGQTNYAAAKAGIIAYVRKRADALVGRGVSVNAVAPGFIETRMTASMPPVVRQAGRRLSALGQGGLPCDVAEVITFLASPGSAGLNASVVRVCGGALLGA